MNKSRKKYKLQRPSVPLPRFLGSVVALALLISGCGQDTTDQDMDLAATEQEWSSKWPYEDHRYLTDTAFSKFKKLPCYLGIFDKGKVKDGNDGTDEGSFDRRYHFMRLSKFKSSREACWDAQEVMINSVQTAFYYLKHGNRSQFNRWVGVLFHTIQDSTCPEHAKRTGYLRKKLTNVCVSSGAIAKHPLACQHASDWEVISGQSDEFLDPVEHYHEAKAATYAGAGMLCVISKLYRTRDFHSPATIRKAVKWALDRSGPAYMAGINNYVGYFNCNTLRTYDRIVTYPGDPPNGCSKCTADQKCCENTFCIRRTSTCP